MLVVEAIVVMVALLRWRERRQPSPAGEPPAGRIDRLTALRHPSGPALGDPPRRRSASSSAPSASSRQGSTPVQTDPEAWVGSGSDSVKELVALRAGTGFSSELGFSIEADDVTSTEVVAWIDAYARREMAAHPEALVRPDSLATIVSSITGAGPAGEDVVGTAVGGSRRRGGHAS